MVKYGTKVYNFPGEYTCDHCTGSLWANCRSPP